MNKGLEVLEKLVDRLAIKKYDESGNLTYWKSTIGEEYQVIEKELKDYENLKLKHRSMQDEVLNDFKKLKALEIIKELLNLKVIEFLPNDSDTRLFVNCGNFKASVFIPPIYADILKEVLL